LLSSNGFAFSKTRTLNAIAQHWFDVMRNCGDDVQELLHDGHPTACVDDAAFAYANTFMAHVNVGFFLGAELIDPDALLDGTRSHADRVFPSIKPVTDS
jgi:hypothetical protein